MTIPRYYTTLPGWFDFEGLYSQAVKAAPLDAHLVEVGSFMGRSAAYMMEEIQQAAKPLRFSIVDTWQLNADGQPWMSEVCPSLDEWKQRFGGDRFYEHVRSSLDASPARAALTQMLRADSVGAAKRFDDESVWFCFIDACHHFANVKADLAAWWPKIQMGGILAGHDWTDKGPQEAVKSFMAYFGLTQIQIWGNSWIIPKTTFCTT